MFPTKVDNKDINKIFPTKVGNKYSTKINKMVSIVVGKKCFQQKLATNVFKEG